MWLRNKKNNFNYTLSKGLVTHLRNKLKTFTENQIRSQSYVRDLWKGVDLFCFVCGFKWQSTAMVMLRQLVNLTTFFLGKLD